MFLRHKDEIKQPFLPKIHSITFSEYISFVHENLFKISSFSLKVTQPVNSVTSSEYQIQICLRRELWSIVVLQSAPNQRCSTIFHIIWNPLFSFFLKTTLKITLYLIIWSLGYWYQTNIWTPLFIFFNTLLPWWPQNMKHAWLSMIKCLIQ